MILGDVHGGGVLFFVFLFLFVLFFSILRREGGYSLCNCGDTWGELFT